MCCLSRRNTSSYGSKKTKNKQINKRKIKGKRKRSLSSKNFNKKILDDKIISESTDFISPIISKKKLQKRIKNQEKIISKLQNIDSKK